MKRILNFKKNTNKINSELIGSGTMNDQNESRDIGNKKTELLMINDEELFMKNNRKEENINKRKFSFAQASNERPFHLNLNTSIQND